MKLASSLRSSSTRSNGDNVSLAGSTASTDTAATSKSGRRKSGGGRSSKNNLLNNMSPGGSRPRLGTSTSMRRNSDGARQKLLTNSNNSLSSLSSVPSRRSLGRSLSQHSEASSSSFLMSYCPHESFNDDSEWIDPKQMEKVFSSWDATKGLPNYSQRLGAQILLRMAQLESQTPSRLGLEACFPTITSLLSSNLPQQPEPFLKMCDQITSMVDEMVGVLGPCDVADPLTDLGQGFERRLGFDRDLLPVLFHRQTVLASIKDLLPAPDAMAKDVEEAWSLILRVAARQMGMRVSI